MMFEVRRNYERCLGTYWIRSNALESRQAHIHCDAENVTMGRPDQLAGVGLSAAI